MMAIVFDVAVTLSLVAVLWKSDKPLRGIGSPWFGLFCLLSVTSMFYVHYGPQSFLTAKRIVAGLLWLAMLILYVPKDEVYRLLDAMCWACGVNLLVQILQLVPFDNILGCGQPVGLMTNLNLTSAFNAFCLPAFFRPGRWRYSIVPIVGLLISQALMGAVCVVGAVVVVFYLSRSFIAVAVGSVVALALGTYLAVADIPTLTLRINVWKVGLEFYKEHWFGGAGLGHWEIVFLPALKLFDNKRWDYAHNEYLQMLFEMGIGFAVVLAGYGLSVIRRIRSSDLYHLWPVVFALAIIAVNSFGNFCWHIAPTAMIALTWIAIFEINANPNPA